MVKSSLSWVLGCLCMLSSGVLMGHAALCDCLGEEALAQVFGPHAFVTREGKQYIPVTTSSGLVAYYPHNYGSNCSAWDDMLPSTCADMDGRRNPHRPAWCSAAWCFVNTENCDPKYPSVFFPNTGLFYSYQTCGSGNSFVDHINQNHETVAEMVTVLADYVKSSASTMVSAWHEHDGTYPGHWGRRRRACRVTTGCDCGDCAQQGEGPWHWNHVDFDNSVFYRKGEDTTVANEECMLESMHQGWEATVRLENSKDRFGYLYAGYQSDGSLAQWPAVEWCPVPVDFRFRPWYASAASGPKDVILVIDCSGSMRGERESLAREAAKAVIDTLVDVDRAAIVKFSSLAQGSSSLLLPMTEENKQTAKNWINLNINAYGGTQFKKGFSTAFDILKDSRDANVTSGCKSLMLFLSDGDPSDWDESSYNWLQSKNEEVGDTVIFTYALGSGLTSRGIGINKRIACENRGIFHKIDDSADLASTMANYYLYMGVGADSATLRWRDYEDALTGKRLLTGCLPAFDKRTLPRKLIGVSCMDINTIVTLDELERADGYADFAAQIVNQQSYCAPFRMSHWDMQMLRKEYSDESVCDVESGVNAVVCGDGMVDANPATGNIEQCDDGNAVSGDGCSSTCQLEEGWVCPKYGYNVLSGDFNGYLKRPSVYCHGKDHYAEAEPVVGTSTPWNWCRQGTSRLECAAWCGMHSNCSGFNWYDQAWGITNACCFRERASTKEYHTNTECFEKVKSRDEQIQCSDVGGFIDELNFKCHEWVGYDCETATTDYGYSAAGQQALLINCPSSCGTCAGNTCHPDCSALVDTPDACRDCVGEWGPWSDCHASEVVVFGDMVECLQERTYDVTDHGFAGGGSCPYAEGAKTNRKLGIFQLKEWKRECVRPLDRDKAACGVGVRERVAECITDNANLCAQVQARAPWISEQSCMDSSGCEWQTIGWDPVTGCFTDVQCESGNDEDCGDRPRPTNHGCYILVDAARSTAWSLLVAMASLALLGQALG